MVEEATGHEGAELHLHLDEPATVNGVAALDRMVERRRAGEPLQYVLGRWGFRTLDLMVDERVLIPRPETEGVVDHVLAELDRVVDDAGPPDAERGRRRPGLRVRGHRPGRRRRASRHGGARGRRRPGRRRGDPGQPGRAGHRRCLGHRPRGVVVRAPAPGPGRPGRGGGVQPALRGRRRRAAGRGRRAGSRPVPWCPDPPGWRPTRSSWPRPPCGSPPVARWWSRSARPRARRSAPWPRRPAWSTSRSAPTCWAATAPWSPEHPAGRQTARPRDDRAHGDEGGWRASGRPTTQPCGDAEERADRAALRPRSIASAQPGTRHGSRSGAPRGSLGGQGRWPPRSLRRATGAGRRACRSTRAVDGRARPGARRASWSPPCAPATRSWSRPTPCTGWPRCRRCRGPPARLFALKDRRPDTPLAVLVADVDAARAAAAAWPPVPGPPGRAVLAGAADPRGRRGVPPPGTGSWGATPGPSGSAARPTPWCGPSPRRGRPDRHHQRQRPRPAHPVHRRRGRGHPHRSGRRGGRRRGRWRAPPPPSSTSPAPSPSSSARAPSPSPPSSRSSPTPDPQL